MALLLSLSFHRCSTQVENFRRAIARSAECEAVNTVRPRSFNGTVVLQPWPLDENVYRRSHHLLPYCNGTAQLLASLKYGVRSDTESSELVSTKTDLEIEHTRGQPFIQMDAFSRWFTPAEMCDILGRFSKVVLLSGICSKPCS